MLPGIDSRLRAIHHMQFAQDIADMPLDRLLADDQLIGDLGIGETIRDQAQDLQFAITQVGKEVRSILPGAAQFLHYPRCHTRM